MKAIYLYAIDQASIVSVTDANGIITYANDNFCKISGYSREELVGQDHRIVNSGYHPATFFQEMWSYVLNGVTWKGEICNRAKDGSFYWVRTTITPILDEQGNVSEMISIREDITAEKLMSHRFREKSKTLHYILDAQHIGFFQYLFKENEIRYDDNFLQLLGIQRDEIGNTFEDFLNLFPDNERKMLTRKIREDKLSAGQSFQYVTSFNKANNDIRTIRISGKVITADEQGTPEVLVALVNDLTEKNKLETLLTRTQEVARIGSWELNLKDESIIWSPMTYEIYGYEPYSFVPTIENYLEKMIAPAYRDELITLHEEILKKEGSVQVDLPGITKNGDEIWLRHIINTEKIGEGAFKVFGTTQDIHEQKMLELSHQHSLKKVDMALETAGFGIGEFYYADKNIVVDDHLKELLGLSYLDRHVLFSDLQYAVISEDFENINNKYAEAIKNHQTIIDTQFRVVKSNNEISFIQSRGILEYDANGKALSIMGLFWDITKEKEIENILIETKNKAEEATIMKSSFLASMSHEIRTPMNGVLGMMELLLDTDLTREQKKLLDTMKLCSDNLLTVVNDVLDLSKIEAGKLEFEYRKFSLREMLNKAFDFFKLAADKKGIDFNMQLHQELPEYIEMDEVRLQQVLNNLLSNALKFTPEGSIELLVYPNQAALVHTIPNSGKMSISFIVKDTGIGIKEENLGKLFTSFSQVDTSITRKFGGTGLGLAISKSLVENMGGEVKVKSRYGEGTTFKFNILCEYSNQIESQIIERPNYNYRNDLRLLVAEDNPINQTLVSHLFKKLGLTIDIADNGEKALYMVKKNKYDMVFMDLQMPKMDGITATKKIMNAHSLTEKPLIVAMTANVFEEDRNRCFSAGMSDFVAKPLSSARLREVLTKFFPDLDSENENSEKIMHESSKYKLICEKQILFEFEDDFDIFEELINDYQKRFSNMVEEIEKAYSIGDTDGVRVAAHTLKGVVSNFYSKELTDAAFQMEMSGKNGDLSLMDKQLQNFLNYNDGVLAELFSLVQENKSKNSDEAA